MLGLLLSICKQSREKHQYMSFWRNAAVLGYWKFLWDWLDVSSMSCWGRLTTAIDTSFLLGTFWAAHADAAGLIMIGVYSSGERAGNKKYCITQPFTLMRWNSHDGLWVLIEGRDWSRQAPPMFHGFHVKGNFVFQNCVSSCGPYRETCIVCETFTNLNNNWYQGWSPEPKQHKLWKIKKLSPPQACDCHD